MSPPAPDPGGRPVGGPTRGIAPPGYRLRNDLRLGPVKLQVASLERSLEFYNEVIGLRTLESERDGAKLSAPPDKSPLVELSERPGATPVPRRGRLGLYHFALRLPDRAALGRFVRHASAIGIRLGAADHAVSEAIYLSDPNGLGIEVYADRPRSQWRYRGRQLVMGTDPLDVADLVDHAGSDGFNGLPSETIVGHVHLHVGDLDRAAEFYHGALGFDKVVWDYPGALFLSAGGYHHHLGVNTWAAPAPAAGPDDAKLLAWTIILPTAADADGAAESIRSAGYPVDGGSGCWLAEDPWGTVVEIYSAPSPDPNG